ncbi:MAG: ISNCY family transposase, partial [Bacteroidetes bacterium]|nr:ISNCY family transposase [Bacteroidota bacterium]
ALLPPRKRNNSEPSRRSQGAHMFPSPAQPDQPPVKRKRGRPPLPRLTPIEAAQRMLEGY